MKYFESKDDVFHFLVCPQDDFFITNTLEKLNYHEYMYRLLRDKGYERIIFFEYIRELNGKDVQSKRILTFDRYSYESYINQKVYEDENRTEHVEVRSNEKKPLNTAKYNEAVKGTVKMHSLFKERSEKIKNTEDENREIISLSNNEFRKFVSSKTFDDPGLIYSEIINNIVPALLSEKIRTAIIMPVGIFKEVQNSRKSAALGDVVDALNDVYEHQNLKNILIFTMNELGSLEEMCPFFDMLRGFKSGKSDGLDGAIKYLSKNNRFNQVGEIGIDEITNLLLRKKMNIDSKNNERIQSFYDKIPYVKLNALSYMIYEQYKEGTENFKNLEFPNTITFGIKRLETELESEELLSELVERSLTVPALELKLYNETAALDLSRFTHEKIRVNISDNDTIENIYAEFDKLTGEEMKAVKKSVIRAINYFSAVREEMDAKEEQGETISPDDFPYINMLFFGAPGTGKTTIAKLIARLMYAKKILKTSRVKVVQAGELVGNDVGGVQKRLRAAAENAVDGVLLIDELQAVKGAYQGGDLAEDFMRGLVGVINEYRGKMCVILCGYEEEVTRIIKFDKGANRRFPRKIKMQNYGIDTLMLILDKMIEDDNKTLEDGVREKLRKIIRADMDAQDKEFGNAGYIKDELLDKIKENYYQRGKNDNIYTMEDVMNAFPDKLTILNEADDSAERVMEDFDKLTGEEMRSVKSTVIKAVNYFAGAKKELEARSERGERITPDDFPYINMLFFGAPGTGKTTIAKLIARLMYAKKVLPTNKVHTIQAGKLVGNDVGGVQKRLREEVENNAIGGVLVIDELQAVKGAYQGGDLAEDFMRGLVGIINEYKHKLCVILCGYEEEVTRIIKFDKGANRRFPRKIKMQNYGIDTLMLILDKMIEDDNKTLEDGVREKLRKIIRADMDAQDKEFGNAGYIKDELLDKIKENYYQRGKNDNIYTMEDVTNAFPDKINLLSENEDTAETIMIEFDKLTGEEMQKVKSSIIKTINYFAGSRKELEQKAEQGVEVTEDDYPYINMLFFGAPGTGKTTIAKLIARLMYAKKILPSNKIHTIQAGKLVGNDVGGVQKRLREEVENNAIGGVLVIDELQAVKGAYQGGDLAEDFMRGLVGVINEYKHKLCVILCGYEEEVLRIIQYDRGANRRFPRQIKMESYGIDSLMMILDNMLSADNKTLEEGVRERLKEIIELDMKKQGREFGNAGYLKDYLLDKIKENYFDRGVYDNIYTMEDVNNAFPKESDSKHSDANRQMFEYNLSLDYVAKLPEPYKYKNDDYEKPEEVLFKITEPSVLYLEVEFSGNKGFGTGFLIHPDGYALTCNHVIKSREGKVADKITARLRIPGRMGGEDTYHNCIVVKTFEDLDMALIKTTDGSNFPYLNLEKQDFEAKEFDEFLLLGYPFGERTKAAISVNVGRIVSVQNNPDGNGIDRYNIQCEAKKGNSGSPAISLKTGSVIGLLPGAIKAYEGDYEEINYLRPIKYFWTEFFK